jgi:surface polysaccharide O-acyltransferase-like enzyme
MNATSSWQQRRNFGMDWLRIGAFLLLILYHVGLAFGPWRFEIKVAEPRDWVAIPLLATNAWRLPLLFLVSGYASAALLQRQPAIGAFTRSRLARLGLPLLFGILLLNTPQPWVALVTQHGLKQSFGDFFLHTYFHPQDIDGIKVPTWMHLWFVVYLLAYTLLLGGMLRFLPGLTRRLGHALERLVGEWRFLPLPIVYVFLVRHFLPPGWTDTHGLVDDWSAHAVYLPAFALGLLLQRSALLQQSVERWWKVAAVAALLAYAVVVVVELNWPGLTPLPPQVTTPYELVRSVLLWGGVIALVGAANRFLNHDHLWRATLAEAVFPLYLIHQTIILVVGYWLLTTPTSALLRFVILVAATFLGSLAFYFVGREIGWLRRWIGLKPRRPLPISSESSPA